MEPYGDYIITKRTSNVIASAIDMILGETDQEKFNTLLKCKCCDRHQTNKPQKLEPWIECTSNGMMKDDTSVQCECDCRHLARILCRNCD